MDEPESEQPDMVTRAKAITETVSTPSTSSTRVWSPLQNDIFQFIETGKGSAVVCAVAGSGKTTTIVEAANRVQPGMVCCFVAFNRSIADELSKRLPSTFPAKTLNGFGYSAWLRHLGKQRVKLDANKTMAIIRRRFTETDMKLYAKIVAQLVAKAKVTGLVPTTIGGLDRFSGLSADTESNWVSLMEMYDIYLENGAIQQRAIELARKTLALSILEAEDTVDFDDQLYMPVISRIHIKQHDILFVDEAQDINNVQRALLRLALKPQGRLIAVGDPHQAIYGFRGATVESIERIKDEFNAIELPLSISYRCPKSVVAEAQKVVSHIQSSPTAIEGAVEFLTTFEAKTFTATDGVVCRNTAPLITLAYRLLTSQVPCRVLGREIGQGLIKLIEKMNASSVDQLETKLQEFQNREVAKFVAKGQEQAAAAVEDKVEAISVFIQMLAETNRTIDGLVRQIESLFTDNHAGVTTLCTVHKAKGLEWPRVFILDSFRMPSKYARQAWQLQQEMNIKYVAITRAQQTLSFIDMENFGKKSPNNAITSH